MDRREKLLKTLADRLDLPMEPLPGVPVAELWGSGRVLVENHKGVRGYSEQEILVGVNYGILKIQGEHLQITLMTGEQLIVTGEIQGITLNRRGAC